MLGTLSPDHFFPGTGVFLQRTLGLEGIPALDVRAQCSGFVYGLSVADAWIRTGQYRTILLVGVEIHSTGLDLSTEGRDMAVLFGDGAAAAVVSLRVPGPARALYVSAQSSPKGAAKVLIPRTGYFKQDGRAVQMFAIKRTREGYARIVEARDEAESEGRPLHFVGHQANLRVLEQVCERCGIAPERHHANVELHGNTGGASAPSVLSMNWDKWRPGDDVGVSVVGGGLTWGRAMLRFGDAA